MNIFYLSEQPDVSARWLCDKHIPKMLLETCQMLSTAVHRQAPHLIKGDSLYKSAYANHPMTKWVGDSLPNFLWAYDHARAINDEYQYRFGKIHKSERILDSIAKIKSSLYTAFADIQAIDKTTVPQCMPDQYRHEDPVTAYKNYYYNEKKYFAKWEKGRPKPVWFKQMERGDNAEQ
jgi:hypothetical protein